MSILCEIPPLAILFYAMIEPFPNLNRSTKIQHTLYLTKIPPMPILVAASRASFKHPIKPTTLIKFARIDLSTPL
jgi:hypothetical protein